MTPLRITNMAPDERGFHTAIVSAPGGTAVRVDDSQGSWTHTIDPKADAGGRVPRREVLPELAHRLAERLAKVRKGDPVDDGEDVELDANAEADVRAIAERMARAAHDTIKEAA